MSNTGEQEKDWERCLHRLLGEIEIANGERIADSKLGARVRIAWEQAYQETQDAA